MFRTKQQAKEHLKLVVSDYKANGINEYIDAGEVGFNDDTSKCYVMNETDESFSYYMNGYI